MALLSFIGRLLFVSVFVLAAYQEFNEFGVDGGPAALQLKPKFVALTKHVATHTGFQIPPVEMKDLIFGAIIWKALGSFLFIFGSSFGAVILLLHQAITVPILYDFYNYDADKKEFAQLFVKFTQNLSLLGALLFFIGMNNKEINQEEGCQIKNKLRAQTAVICMVHQSPTAICLFSQCCITRSTIWSRPQFSTHKLFYFRHLSRVPSRFSLSSCCDH